MPTAKKQDRLAKQLWAIGDVARLRLLQLLSNTEDCHHGNNVSSLAEKLQLAQPTVSHHLRILRLTGLVKNKKMCRDVFYWIDAEEAEKVLSELTQVLRTTPTETSNSAQAAKSFEKKGSTRISRAKTPLVG